MCGNATLVMDASTKSRNATAQSKTRIRLPRPVASVKDAEPVVIPYLHMLGISNVGASNVG
jgi:predicted RNA-binding protein